MASMEFLPRGSSASITQSQDPSRTHVGVRVKELTERDRRRLLMHFLALADSDRLLRFGTELQDHLITRYVQRLDFVRDTVLGVFNHDLHLTAVAHLNFVPYDSNPLFNGVTDKSRVAEFGLSVLSESRDQGYATRLIERAVSHCRNENVDTLYMHYLASNEAVLYIAQKAGMVITYVPGQHEAFLKLPVISPEPN